jgi:hypothetical protein
MAYGSPAVLVAGATPFLVVGIPLISVRSTVVWPTVMFVAVLVVGSAVYFVEAWANGVRFQGMGYTLLAAIANGALGALCVWLCLRALRGKAKYMRRYCATFVPCSWLAYCAFPWLGEVL